MNRWVDAARPRTLPLAVGSILLGNFLAYATGKFDFLIALLATLTTVLLQILSNFANDLGDYINGADTVKTRDDRALSSNAITQKDMFIATSALIDLGVDSSRAVVYIMQGYFTSEHIILIPFLIVIAVLGSYLGKKVLAFIPEKYFHYVVLGVIGTISILQTIQYFRA